MRFWILAAVVASLGLGLIGCSEESAPAPKAPANATANKHSPPPAASSPASATSFAAGGNCVFRRAT